MGLPVPSFNPNNPIPNSNFSYPQKFFVNGPWFPIEIGDGVVINTDTPKIANLSNSGVLDFSGITGAINLVGGTGISVVESPSANSTDFTITNEGVTQLIAGGNINITGSNGVYTISASDAQTGTVTSVATGAGLTGGPITTDGTISLAPSGVTPGSYTYPDITVDAYGRITVAANGTTPVTAITGTSPVQVTGTAPSLTISVAASSTSAPGIVQLNDTTNSTSTTQALTANAGNILQQQINALAVSSNITLAGTIDASTGLMVTVTTEGITRGFAVGSPLPAPASGNDNYFAIVTIAGTMTPPGGVSQVCHVGDWWLSSGTEWQFLDVAAPAPTVDPATPIAPGVVLGCTVNNVAYLGCFAGYAYSGDNAVAIGCQALPGGTGCQNVAIGTQTLFANVSGAYNTAIGTCALCNTTTGSYNTAIGPFAGYDNPTGSYNIHIGLVSGGNNPGDCNITIGNYVHPPTTGGCQLAIGFGTGQCWLTGNSTQAIKPGAGIIDCANSCGTAGQVLMSTGSNSICWGTAGGGGIPCSTLTAKGDILSATAASTPSVLTLGTDGQVLFACAACSTGLTWAAPVTTPAATPTVLGTLLGCSKSTGTLSTALGYNALAGNPTGNWNVAVGSGAGQSLTTGQWNTFIGNCAGQAATTATASVAIGINAAQLSNGSASIFIGNSAGYRSGDSNVAIGSASMSSTCTCTTRTVAIGSNTARFGSGNDNVAIGFSSACVPSCGGCNTVIGSGSLQGVGVTATTAPCNTSLGFKTLNAATTACLNVALGFAAGCSITSGAQNVLIGPNVGLSCTTENCTLAIGYSNTALWLTGDSTKAIKPGAGIIDCANSCGTAGQVLMSNGSNAVCWGTVASCPGTVTSITAGTGLTGGTITSSGTVALDTACVIQPSVFTAKGDIITATAVSTPTALGVGTDGQVLSACSTCASGLYWATPQTSPFVTYTTSAVSYTSGTPLLVGIWAGGTMQATISLDLVGYGGINIFWDVWLSGDPTNYNTGWNNINYWPTDPASGAYQGSWYVDFPVYPDPNANKWMLYFSPSTNSLNPSTFTFFYRLLPGSAAVAWQI